MSRLQLHSSDTSHSGILGGDKGDLGVCIELTKAKVGLGCDVLLL